MSKDTSWLAGLFSNPKTGQASHTKLWANVAAGVMTYKFAMLPDAPEWAWWAYGAMVGIRRNGGRLRAHQTRHRRRAAASGITAAEGAGRCGQS